MANPDAKGTPEPPPNLRVSDDENKECDTCSHYERGKCTMFSNLPVDGEWVCDKWEASGKPDDDVPVGKQPKTLSEARVRVREHFRRLRAPQE